MKYDMIITRPDGSFKFYGLTAHQIFHVIKLNEDSFGRENIKVNLYID